MDDFIGLNVSNEELAFIKQSVEINLSLIEIAHYSSETSKKLETYHELLSKINNLVEESGKWN